MKNILYYISGHGYGHSTRSIEIIRQLTEIHPEVFVHIKTNAPQWIFHSGLHKQFKYHHLKHDIGAVQSNSFSVNKQETLKQYAQLITNKSTLIEQEIAFVHKNNIKLIVSDISPLALEISKAAHLPSIAIGNFSWDWIYCAWMDEFPHYKFVIEDIQQAYAYADVLLRLPFYGDMSAFSPIEDVPLVARKANESREVTLRQIGLAAERRKIVLLGLRRQDLGGVDWSNVQSIKNTLFISFSGDYPTTNFIKLPPECVPFQNLVHSVDAVLSKPGYSIVAECFINQTPMLYVPRADFIEEEVLRESLEQYSVSQLLPMTDFKRGNWSNYLQSLFQKDGRWGSLATNGSEVVVKKIFEKQGIAVIPPN